MYSIRNEKYTNPFNTIVLYVYVIFLENCAYLYRNHGMQSYCDNLWFSI